MNRREWLKYLGGGAVVTAGLGAGATIIGRTCRTVVVPEGARRQLTLTDGEAVEGLTIDITALDADAQIVARGSGWTIKNIHFNGSTDLGAKSGGFPNLIDAQGNGVIDSVYLGDGVSNDGIWRGAIGVGTSHSGHIDVQNCYMAGWTDNAVYAATMAEEKLDNAGYGTLAFDNCYLRDNNVAHLRIASDGTTVRNTVIKNTNRVPEIYDGVVSSRGVYTGYGHPDQVVSIQNCDIDVTPKNTNGEANALVSGHHPEWGPCSTLDVRASQIRGKRIGHVETTNVGTTPDGEPPDAVQRRQPTREICRALARRTRVH